MPCIVGKNWIICVPNQVVLRYERKLYRAEWGFMHFGFVNRNGDELANWWNKVPLEVQYVAMFCHLLSERHKHRRKGYEYIRENWPPSLREARNRAGAGIFDVETNPEHGNRKRTVNPPIPTRKQFREWRWKDVPGWDELRPKPHDRHQQEAKEEGK